MNTIFSAVSGFTTLFILNLWIFDRSTGAAIDIITFNASKEYVPLYGLTFGALLTLFSYWIFYEASKLTGGRTWVDRIPSPWVDMNQATEKQKKIWKQFVYFVVIIFPLIASIHFWSRLDNWQAWNNCAIMPNEEEITLWSYPEASFTKNCDFWDAYRYGDYKQRTTESHHGTSYVPLLEPTACVLLTSSMFISAFLISRKLFYASPN